MKGWRRGSATHTTQTLPDLLNRWLERTALSDLARLELGVRATLQGARAAGWSMPHEPESGLFAPRERGHG